MHPPRPPPYGILANIGYRDRDEEGTWLAREKQKRRRSYLLCGVAFLTALIMGIGIGALVTVIGNREH